MTYGWLPKRLTKEAPRVTATRHRLEGGCVPEDGAATWWDPLMPRDPQEAPRGPQMEQPKSSPEDAPDQDAFPLPERYVETIGNSV